MNAFLRLFEISNVWRLLLLAAALSAGACVSGKHSMSVSLGEVHGDALSSSGVVSVPAGGGIFSPPSNARVAKDDRVLLVCWNVHKSTGEGFRRELEEVVNGAGDCGEVIFCLQEAKSATFDDVRQLGDAPLAGHYAESWRYPMSKNSTGVMTVSGSGLPALNSQRLRSAAREFCITSPKVSLVSELGLANGQQLTVINCHGLAFVTDAKFAAQLDAVFSALEGAVDGQAPSAVIVCGDFNVWSSARLSALEQRAAAAGLTEAVVNGHSGPDTPPILGMLSPLVGYDSAIPLDRIYSRGIDVLECRTVEGLESSDHAPLVLEFSPRG